MVIAVKVVVTVVHNHIAPLCGYLHRLAAGAVVVAKLLLGLAVPRLYFTLARPRQIERGKLTGCSILLARSFGPVPRFRLRSFRTCDVILLAVASWWNSSSRFVRYQSVSRGLITTGEPGNRLTSVRALVQAKLTSTAVSWERRDTLHSVDRTEACFVKELPWPVEDGSTIHRRNWTMCSMRGWKKGG